MLYDPDQVSYQPGSFFQRIKRVAIERALIDTPWNPLPTAAEASH
jgi:hypothetical protein